MVEMTKKLKINQKDINILSKHQSKINLTASDYMIDFALNRNASDIFMSRHKWPFCNKI